MVRKIDGRTYSEDLRERESQKCSSGVGRKKTSALGKSRVEEKPLLIFVRGM